jgi:tetratricopeptide (TPR) repeat protein
MGKVKDAETALTEAGMIAQTLLEKTPNDENARYYLFAARSEQGAILADVNKEYSAAEKVFDEAERGLSSLRSEFPDVGYFRPKHAEALAGRAGARAGAGRLQEAEEDCRQAQRTLESILAGAPRDLNASSLLAATLVRRAHIAHARGDHVQAAKHWSQAISYQGAVVKAVPKNPRAESTLKRMREERQAALAPR